MVAGAVATTGATTGEADMAAAGVCYFAKLAQAQCGHILPVLTAVMSCSCLWHEHNVRSLSADSAGIDMMTTGPAAGMVTGVTVMTAMMTGNGAMVTETDMMTVTTAMMTTVAGTSHFTAGLFWLYQFGMGWSAACTTFDEVKLDLDGVLQFARMFWCCSMHNTTSVVVRDVFCSLMSGCCGCIGMCTAVCHSCS